MDEVTRWLSIEHGSPSGLRLAARAAPGRHAAPLVLHSTDGREHPARLLALFGYGSISCPLAQPTPIEVLAARLAGDLPSYGAPTQQVAHVRRSSLQRRSATRDAPVPRPRVVGRRVGAAARARLGAAGASRQPAALRSSPRWGTRRASARTRESDPFAPKDPPLPPTLVALSGKAPL